jgi:hypothetical protein
MCWLSGCTCAAHGSLLRRTHGAIRGWWRYLESPQARRFYETHRARIEAEIQAGLRRQPKDPGSRPWRKKKSNPENPNPKNPKNPENPSNPCLRKDMGN